MRITFFGWLFRLFSSISVPHAQHEQAIRQVLEEQQAAWNRADLEGFMQGYWQSDSLMFIGKNGLKYGWENTLKGYQKGYPDAKAMGTLTFGIQKVEVTRGKTAFVVGSWHLAREAGDLQGYFTLYWKKIKGKWVIVADHSS